MHGPLNGPDAVLVGGAVYVTGLFDRMKQLTQASHEERRDTGGDVHVRVLVLALWRFAGGRESFEFETSQLAAVMNEIAQAEGLAEEAEVSEDDDQRGQMLQAFDQRAPQISRQAAFQQQLEQARALRNLGGRVEIPPPAVQYSIEGRKEVVLFHGRRDAPKYTVAEVLRRLDEDDRPPEVTPGRWFWMRAAHLEPHKTLEALADTRGVSRQAVKDALKKGYAMLAAFVEQPGAGDVVEAPQRGGLTPDDGKGMHAGSAGQSHALRSHHEAMADHLGNLIMGEKDDARRDELLAAYRAVVEEGAAGNDRGPALAAATRRYGQETPDAATAGGGVDGPPPRRATGRHP